METHFDAVGKSVAGENEAAKGKEVSAPGLQDDALARPISDPAVGP